MTKSVQVLQSSKSRNAARITELHASIAARKATAADLYKLAHRLMAWANQDTGTVKALAKQQVSIKRDLKGPPKPKRAAKPDSRIVVSVTVGDDVSDADDVVFFSDAGLVQSEARL